MKRNPALQASINNNKIKIYITQQKIKEKIYAGL
jgi:hypothetical protein